MLATGQGRLSITAALDIVKSVKHLIYTSIWFSHLDWVKSTSNIICKIGSWPKMTGEAPGGAHLDKVGKVANIFKCLLCITHVLGLFFIPFNLYRTLRGKVLFLLLMRELMLSELLFWSGLAFFVFVFPALVRYNWQLNTVYIQCVQLDDLVYGRIVKYSPRSNESAYLSPHIGTIFFLCVVLVSFKLTCLNTNFLWYVKIKWDYAGTSLEFLIQCSVYTIL